MPNVVYKFTCRCFTGKTYVGMSSRHLVTKLREYLNLNNNRKSAIKDHLQDCESCSKGEINLHSSFTVLSKCSSEYIPKIHDTLLIKQSKPLLNKQLYANGCSFLLRIFKCLCLIKSQPTNLRHLRLFR